MKLLLALALTVTTALGCTNLLVTPGASHEGTATISYLADTGASQPQGVKCGGVGVGVNFDSALLSLAGTLYGSLGHYPRMNETTRQTYDWDTGRAVPST